MSNDLDKYVWQAMILEETILAILCQEAMRWSHHPAEQERGQASCPLPPLSVRASARTPHTWTIVVLMLAATVIELVGQFGTGQFGTGQFGTRTIWHQDYLAPDNLAPGQFGTNIIKTDNLAPNNLAPGQFGTRTIWHRTIWHQDNLAPNIWND